jgi:hypothetical protein
LGWKPTPFFYSTVYQFIIIDVPKLNVFVILASI